MTLAFGLGIRLRQFDQFACIGGALGDVGGLGIFHVGVRQQREQSNVIRIGGQRLFAEFRELGRVIHFGQGLDGHEVCILGVGTAGKSLRIDCDLGHPVLGIRIAYNGVISGRVEEPVGRLSGIFIRALQSIDDFGAAHSVVHDFGCVLQLLRQFDLRLNDVEHIGHRRQALCRYTT